MPRCARNFAAGSVSSRTASSLRTIFVTHDQEEAFEVADRVVLIDKGRVQQIGTPDEVRKAPANQFVAGVSGYSLIISGQDDRYFRLMIFSQKSLCKPFKYD